MQVSPGKHRIKIALPGYQVFETEVVVGRSYLGGSAVALSCDHFNCTRMGWSESA